MESKESKPEYKLSLGKLIKGSRVSYTLMILICVLWGFFGINLLLNMVGLSLGGLNRLGLDNVFKAFVTISIIGGVPILLITSIQKATLQNGLEVVARITNVRRDRNYLIVSYRYNSGSVTNEKTRIIKCNDKVDLSYFEKGKEEKIVVHESNPNFTVFIDHSFIQE